MYKQSRPQPNRDLPPTRQYALETKIRVTVDVETESQNPCRARNSPYEYGKHCSSGLPNPWQVDERDQRRSCLYFIGEISQVPLAKRLTRNPDMISVRSMACIKDSVWLLGLNLARASPLPWKSGGGLSVRYLGSDTNHSTRRRQLARVAETPTFPCSWTRRIASSVANRSNGRL